MPAVGDSVAVATRSVGALRAMSSKGSLTLVSQAGRRCPCGRGRSRLCDGSARCTSAATPAGSASSSPGPAASGHPAPRSVGLRAPETLRAAAFHGADAYVRGGSWSSGSLERLPSSSADVRPGSGSDRSHGRGHKFKSCIAHVVPLGIATSVRSPSAGLMARVSRGVPPMSALRRCARTGQGPQPSASLACPKPGLQASEDALVSPTSGTDSYPWGLLRCHRQASATIVSRSRRQRKPSSASARRGSL